MAVEWFCRISGEVAGPFSPHQLKELVQEGRLAPQDQVRQGTDGSWAAADRVKGLFSSARAVRSEPDLPVAQPLTANPVDDGSQKSAAGKAATTTPAVIPTAEQLDLPSARPIPPPPQTSGLPPANGPAAEGPAASPSPFEIHADAERPVARGTILRKKDRKSVFLVGGSLAVLVVCLVVVVVLVDPAMNRQAEESETASTDRSAATQRSAEEDLDALIDGPPEDPSKTLSNESPPEPQADEPQEPEPQEPEPQEDGPQEDGPQEPEPQEDEIKWLPAKQPIRIENVRVEILSVEIGRPRLIDESGEVSQYGQNFLLITVGLQNVDEKNELKYTSWGVRGPTSKGLTLSDVQGKRYPTLRPSNYRIKGQLAEETLAPSASVEDVLVFQAPDDPTEALHLQLPCAAFGQKDWLYLEIPPDMIRVAEGSADRGDGPGGLPEMGLGISARDGDGRNSRISSATPRDPFDEDEDPDGDVSQIFRDIDELGGGEKEEKAQRPSEEEEEGGFFR
ncbi:MAG: DUF4339 domain-containing protein [Thermoguttaceae bacterium]